MKLGLVMMLDPTGIGTTGRSVELAAAHGLLGRLATFQLFEDIHAAHLDYCLQQRQHPARALPDLADRGVHVEVCER